MKPMDKYAIGDRVPAYSNDSLFVLFLLIPSLPRAWVAEEWVGVNDRSGPRTCHCLAKKLHFQIWLKEQAEREVASIKSRINT